ncbi:uncharacterized protein [Branchiostoma lanceolatum]|uniref:uncharacterized protein n=1 Tax=Branchiostoma lanceolatum TaxID=7740 RepID=UPI003452FAF2
MWKFLLFISAVIVWPGSAQGERVFLATHENWAFYKVRVEGQMIGNNLLETCENAKMENVCYGTGGGRCKSNWELACISFNKVDISCTTLAVLSSKLCGNTDYLNCQPLDDIFLYRRMFEGGSWGMDYDTHVEKLPGEDYNDKYAVCAEVSNCASSPCATGTCTDDGLGSYTCTPCEEGTSCDQDKQVYLTTHDNWAFFKVLATGPMTQGNVKDTCEATGMGYPCWRSGTKCLHALPTWSDDCIAFDLPDGSDCRTPTLGALSIKLCGNDRYWQCPPLFGTFVYFYTGSIYTRETGARGVEFGSDNMLHGDDYYNKYALCATRDTNNNGRGYSSASCATGMYYTPQHSMFPYIMLFSIYAWIQIRMF